MYLRDGERVDGDRHAAAVRPVGGPTLDHSTGQPASDSEPSAATK